METRRHGQELGRSWIKHDSSATPQFIAGEEDILEHKEGIERKHDWVGIRQVRFVPDHDGNGEYQEQVI